LEDTLGDIGTVNVYQETPALLQLKPSTKEQKHYHSALLKSNCRVTSQPDWGDVFITYTPGEHDVDEKSLLRYIISFRDECHFHEEICETIYKRLHDVLKPQELSVMCLYARRGGIDINPQRASSEALYHGVLSNVEFCHLKTPKQ
jgi:7-cyano-7-deazaguanine reductase